MTTTWPTPGTLITPLHEVEAYYSGYGDRPLCYLQPGEPAVVQNVDVPPVTGRRGNYLTALFTRHSVTQTVALRPGEYRVLHHRATKENPV